MFHGPDVKTSSVDRMLCRNIRSASKLNKQLFPNKKSSVHAKRTAKQFKLSKEELEKAKEKYLLQEANKSRTRTLERLAKKRKSKL